MSHLVINILTLGLFRVVIDTLGLYLAAFIFSDFYVKNIHSAQTSFFGINIPELNFNNFVAFLVTSLTIGFILNLFTLIIRKKPKNENSLIIIQIILSVVLSALIFLQSSVDDESRSNLMSQPQKKEVGKRLCLIPLFL